MVTAYLTLQKLLAIIGSIYAARKKVVSVARHKFGQGIYLQGIFGIAVKQPHNREVIDPY